MTAISPALERGLFSAIATLIDLLTQELSLQFYQGWYFIYVSIVAVYSCGLLLRAS